MELEVRRRRITAVLAAATVALGLSACTPDGAAPPAPTASTATGPLKVTLAVYGPDAVISAYMTIAARFSADNPNITIDIRPYQSHRLAMAALARTRGTAQEPDIFLAGQSDLPSLMRTGANQRVDTMLSNQNVDFGDGYERASLEAFSADSALQCMPVDISPLVVYYNRGLVKLETLRPEGNSQPNPDAGWRFDDFVAAARQASVGAKRGVYISPEIKQLAPFLFSAGGQIVDSTSDPKQLTLADESDAVQQILGLLRNPTLTFTADQLKKKNALSRFKQGQLGMILGYRAMTPGLRHQDGLDFGVMPIPRLGRSSTITEATGLCVKPKLPHRTSTSRFLAYLVSDQASRVLASTGYITPANSTVLNSDAFEDRARLPTGSSVFASQIRYTQELPEGEAWRRAQPTLNRSLSRLLYGTSVEPLKTQLDQIDSTVSPLLSGVSPGASPSGSPSASPAG